MSDHRQAILRDLCNKEFTLYSDHADRFLDWLKERIDPRIESLEQALRKRYNRYPLYNGAKSEIKKAVKEGTSPDEHFLRIAKEYELELQRITKDARPSSYENLNERISPDPQIDQTTD